jgi:hypothetical protein
VKARKNSPLFRHSGSAEVVRFQTAKSYCDLKSRQGLDHPADGDPPKFAAPWSRRPVLT